MYSAPNQFSFYRGNPGYEFSGKDGQHLYWVSLDGQREWICQAFSISAIIMNEDGSRQSLLFCFENRFGTVQQCQLDTGEISNGNKLFKQLADLGFYCSIQSNARRLFRNYLLRASVEEILIRSERPGWLKKTYLLPAKIYSADPSNLIYTGDKSQHSGIKCRGNLQGWQQNISTACSGNPILELCVSCAFVGPLLELFGMPAFFLHLCGPSRTGKTTALKVSNSVWRGPEGLISWDMTPTSIEPELELNRDGVMYFTEIHLVDKKLILPLVYQLTNGQSRLRRGKRSDDKKTQAVAVIVSDGEKSLKQLLLDAKQEYPGGLQSRLIDLQGWSEIFPSRHGAVSAASLADKLGNAVKECYGTAADAFLEFLVRTDLEQLVADYRAQESFFLEKLSAKYFSGPVHMVAKQFFLIGFAGELATQAKVTGWTPGRAGQVAEEMFELWLRKAHGFGSRDRLVMLSALEHYLRQNQALIVPFEETSGGYFEPPEVIGYSRKILHKTVLFLKYSSFKENFSGQFDFKEFCRVLCDAGLLEVDGLGKVYVAARIPNKFSKPENYVRVSNILSVEGILTIVKSAVP